MNTKGPRRGRGFTVGGSVIGSVIGDGNKNTSITVHSAGEGGSAALEDLQEAIAVLLARIEDMGSSEAVDDRIRYELQAMEEELDEDEPDGAVVQSRWKRVQKFLVPLQQVTSIAETADRIVTLIRTLFTAS